MHLDWRRVLREPLLHFVVLGTAVFLLYALARDSKRAPITEDDAPIEQLVGDWRARTGVAPTPAQQERLVREWMEEEALYRRALELGLDRRDTVVRRRLVQRMRFLIEDTAPVPEPDEAQLRAWIAAHPQDYAVPARVSFEHRFFSRGKRGADLAEDANTAARSLASRPEASVDADPFARGARLDDQTRAQVARSFGAAFADEVFELPVGPWAGPIESSYGLHVVRVTSRRAEAPASLDDVRKKAAADWAYAERQRLNRLALDRIVDRYAEQESAAP